MAKLSVQEVKNFKIMLHELKEAFLKKREESQGSHERMKNLVDKCVQAYNEAEKRKALGRPGIDPRMASKKKKKPAVAEPEAPRQEADLIVFPTSMTGSKPKARSTASELKKTRTAEAEARKRKHPEASATAPSKKKRKTKKERAAPTEPLIVEPISMIHPEAEPQERQLTVHEPAFQGLMKLKTFQQLIPSLLKTLVTMTMLKMMQSFLSSSTNRYHRLCSRTANSSALVVL